MRARQTEAVSEPCAVHSQQEGCGEEGADSVLSCSGASSYLILPDSGAVLLPLISAPPSDISKEQRSPHLSGAASVVLGKKSALVTAKSDDWDVRQMYDRFGSSAHGRG